MSDIAGELARVRAAFGTSTLSLLHQRQASVVIAMFRSSFGRDSRAVPAVRLHEQVETYLAELRTMGADGLPTSSGRDLCRSWVQKQWLVRNLEDDGSESYSLTSHARSALDFVQRLTRERASLSEHRISTIITAVQRLNANVNPDPDARIAILDREIAERVEERDRLQGGGDLAPVSPDYVLTGFGDLLNLISDLPSDFARVREAFVRLRQTILDDFRNETRPAGEVIDAYLRRADTLMTATPEGRAFDGAFALLRDEDLLLQLRENITALLEHPLARDILLDADRYELRGLVTLIRAGMDAVLAQRSRVTATLTEYIVTHDISRDRELDATLRQLDAEVGRWLATSGPRAVMPLPLLPARTGVEHLRERFYDAIAEAPPPPLPVAPIGDHPTVSLEVLRQQGGPTFDALRLALQEALAQPDPLVSLGTIFDGLEASLKRPVEILGLLHLATSREDLVRHRDEEDFTAVRPDGTIRRLRGPRLAPDSVGAPSADVGSDEAPTALTSPAQPSSSPALMIDMTTPKSTMGDRQ
jgi:Protein of unknown function (DUF3375)